MGHVFKLKGRNIWNIKYYVHGRPKYESSRSKYKTDALKLLAIREGMVAEGRELPARGTLKVDDAFKAVIRDYELNGKRSIPNLQYRIKLHLEYFSGWRMSDIRSTHVTRYVDHRREQGASPATINRELAILKRAFTLAMRTGELTSSPYIPRLAEHNARSGFFEREDLDALCAELPAPLRPVMQFAYYTGWRIRAEIIPLTWDRVDREAVYLAPNTTKNKEGRTFPYASVPALKKLIDGQRKVRQAFKTDYVFPDEQGERLSHWYAETWRSACQRAELVGKIPHDFRRTAVRNLVRAGVSEKIAMTMTGHKTRSVFDRYDIVTLTDLKSAASKIR